MNPKNRAWLLIAVVAALCGGSVWGIAWYRDRPIATARLLKRLPLRDALIVYIDFAELRRGGILRPLDGAKIEEDPDYQSFARKIDFDWKQDLDGLILASAPNGNFFFARGHFDWKSLRTYAISVGGECYNSLCRATGSTPERRISFFPVQSRLMALAVSSDQSAVLNLQNSRTGPDPDVPNAPLWVSIPSSLLRSSANLPSGTRMFAHSMEQADSVVLTFAPEGDRIAARLEVRCRNEHDALEVAGQLASATLTLKQMMEREHQTPGPADLAGVLASGNFRSEGSRVLGYWPIERAFVENVLSGGVS
ncbi:MAG TPA: hypothetical protein VGH38_02830 [Bryobacteraceae bacterium]